MISRLFYFFSQPPKHLLSQVTLYYVALAVLVVGVRAFFPEWAALAAGPREAVFDFSGRVDVFEPVQESGEATRLIGVLPLLVSLLSACALMIPVSWTYMGTRTRSGFDQSVVQTMIILPVAVAGVVTIVHDSVALAFSLAGIVAAVRFRNTLKDTSDALYIFAAIAVGLACGVGELPVAAVTSSFINGSILILWRCDYGACPMSGPKEGFSSGRLLEAVGELPEPISAPDGEAKKRKKKKAKKRQPKQEEVPAEVPVAAPVITPTTDGSADPPT